MSKPVTITIAAACGTFLVGVGVLVGLAVAPPTDQPAGPTPAVAVVAEAYIPDPDLVTIVPDAIPTPAGPRALDDFKKINLDTAGSEAIRLYTLDNFKKINLDTAGSEAIRLYPLTDSEKADLHAAGSKVVILYSLSDFRKPPHSLKAHGAIRMPVGFLSYSVEDSIHFITALAAITPDLWGYNPAYPPNSRFPADERRRLLYDLAHGFPSTSAWVLQSHRVFLAWAEALPPDLANRFSVNCILAAARVRANTMPPGALMMGWDVACASPEELDEMALAVTASPQLRMALIDQGVEHARPMYDAGLRLMGQEPADSDEGRRRLEWIDSHDWRLDNERCRAQARADGR